MPYTTTEAGRVFRISRETIRQWSDRFKHHLSPLAQGGGGRHRQYNDDDMTVFALVSEMRYDNHNYDEIDAALAQGQRGNLPNVQAIQEAMSEDDRRQIAFLEQQLTELGVVVEALRNENNRKDGEIDVLTRKLADAEAQLSKLNRELGKLEAKIELLNDDDDNG